MAVSFRGFCTDASTSKPRGPHGLLHYRFEGGKLGRPDSATDLRLVWTVNCAGVRIANIFRRYNLAFVQLMDRIFTTVVCWQWRYARRSQISTIDAAFTIDEASTVDEASTIDETSTIDTPSIQ